MEEPTIEYDQGFLDGLKEGERRIQAQLKPGEFTKGKIDVRIFESMYWVNARDWNMARKEIDRLSAALSKVKEELESKDHCMLSVNIVALIEQALKGE